MIVVIALWHERGGCAADDRSVDLGGPSAYRLGIRLNSAVARTGGLVATALLGSVLAADGDLLLPACHVAMGVGAFICVAASLSALTLLDRNRPGAIELISGARKKTSLTNLEIFSTDSNSPSDTGFALVRFIPR